MKILKGRLVREWIKAVDALCDGDPTYDWNDACRAVAHALENRKSVSDDDIKAAAKTYWGEDQSRGYHVTVGDLQDVKGRIHPPAPPKDDRKDIKILKRFRLKPFKEQP